LKYYAGIHTKLLVFLFAAVVTIAGSAPSRVWAQVPEKVRVGIVTTNTGSLYKNGNAVSFAVKGGYQLIDLAAIPGDDLIGTVAEGEAWQVFSLPGGIQISKNGQPLDKIYTGPVVVREIAHNAANRVSLVNYTASGVVTSIGRWYRGNMEFRTTDSYLVAVNELPTEEYLYGVVGSELNNSWPLEALKAQAVAARTYTVYKKDKRIIEGFNILDTTSDQAYKGASWEGERVIRAVQETTGQIILYNGAAIDAIYHSVSGGHTEDSENVWISALPYLRGKPDPYSTTRGLSNWSYTTTMDDIRNKLVMDGSQVGPIKSFQLEKLPSGRVRNVIITDINGNTITKSGNAFGKLFNPGFKTEKEGNGKRFMSRFFDINLEQVTNPAFSVLNGRGEKASSEAVSLYGVSDDGSVGILNGSNADFFVLNESGVSTLGKAATGIVVFEGHGWGHGVGMSQYGAYEMAEQGKTYRDILTFYYTGVEISG